MSMELGLKFVAVVGADHANPERELGPDAIDKLDCVRLGVAPVDLVIEYARLQHPMSTRKSSWTTR